MRSVQRVSFADGTKIDFAVFSREQYVPPGEDGPYEWLPFSSMRPHGAGSRRTFMTAGVEIAVGLPLIVERDGTEIILPVVTRIREAKRAEPDIDEIEALAVQFEDLFRAARLDQAEAIARRALQIIAERVSELSFTRVRDISFLGPKGARLLALRWSADLAHIYSRATARVRVTHERLRTVEEIRRDAESLTVLRELLPPATEALGFATLERAAKARGVTRTRTLLQWLRENREAYVDDSLVRRGADPSLPPLDGTVPLFRVYFASLKDMGSAQRAFYDEFRLRFLDGELVELQGQWSYCFVLLKDLIRDWKRHPRRARTALQRAEGYPGVRSHAIRWGQDLDDLAAEAAGDTEVWQRRVAGPEAPAEDTPEGVMRRLGADNGLTQWGSTHLSEVILALRGILTEFRVEHGDSVHGDAWTRLIAARDAGDDECPISLDEVLWTDAERRLQAYFEHIELVHTIDSVTLFDGVGGIWLTRELSAPAGGGYAYYWARYIIDARYRLLVREAENAARAGAGLPGVGQGWVSEMSVLRLLRNAFPSERIVHQGRPSWLRPQSLDIHFPERGVAVEYQGEQHSRPVNVFGGKEGFDAQRERDARKRALCEKHGTTLIEVFPGASEGDIVDRVASALGRD